MSISSSLPHRSGARPSSLVLAVLAAAGTALLAAPAAVAAPGDNGDLTVRIEEAGSPADADRPGACEFHLEAAGFDVAPGVAWTIESQPARPGAAQLSGHLTLAAGAGRTDDDMALPEGQYKLTWRTDGGGGAGKQKFFRAGCRSQTPAAGANPERPDERSVERNADQGVERNGNQGPERNGNQGPERNGNQGPERNGNQGAERNGDRPVERGVERNADQDAERNAGPDLAPNGGPPAGGGALAQSRDVDPPGDAPVAGLVAAGLVAVGGAAYFRLRRRRSDGAA